MPFLLAEREEGRLNNELRRLDSEQDDLKDKRNIYEVRMVSDLRVFTNYCHFFCRMKFIVPSRKQKV